MSVLASLVLGLLLVSCRPSGPTPSGGSSTTTSTGSRSNTESSWPSTSTIFGSESTSMEQSSHFDTGTTDTGTTDTGTSSPFTSEGGSQTGTTTSSTSTTPSSSRVIPTIPPRASGPERKVTIAANKIITQDFIGFGANVVPFSLSDKSRSQGFNDAYWELEVQRTIKVQPKVVRVWFQVDWMEPTKGHYTFESDRMKQFYRYMEAFQKAGTEVELNFGWKNGESIHSWFCIPGIQPEISAPLDLEAYARSCSALLHQLINVKKFTNIKYLAFYNEPEGYWDFECYGDQRVYYADMVRAVHNRLVKDGRRKLVKIWGPEGSNPSWLSFMANRIDDCLDAYTYHNYNARAEDLLLNRFPSTLDMIPQNKPLYLTEYGMSTDSANPSATLNSYQGGHGGYLINGANSGIGCFLFWVLSGTWFDTDGGWVLGGINSSMWEIPTRAINPNQVYYPLSLMSRYIPGHSQVLTTTVNSDDIRAATFKKGNDYTIVVECDSTVDKNITVDFGSINVDKKFYKHVYIVNETVPDGNAIIPLVSGTFNGGRSFKDNGVGSKHIMIVYTTLTTLTQVQMDSVKTQTSRTQPIQLGATVLDNTGGVTWSMAYGKGSVSASGLYTPAADAKAGDMVAVKAASVKDPSAYGITLITLQ